MKNMGVVTSGPDLNSKLIKIRIPKLFFELVDSIFQGNRVRISVINNVGARTREDEEIERGDVEPLGAHSFVIG